MTALSETTQYDRTLVEVEREHREAQEKWQVAVDAFNPTRKIAKFLVGLGSISEIGESHHEVLVFYDDLCAGGDIDQLLAKPGLKDALAREVVRIWENKQITIRFEISHRRELNLVPLINMSSALDALVPAEEALAEYRHILKRNGFKPDEYHDILRGLGLDPEAISVAEVFGLDMLVRSGVTTEGQVRELTEAFGLSQDASERLV